MNIYSRKSTWKLLLIASLMLIVFASILYTNFLTRQLAVEEKKRMEELANAYKTVNTAADNVDLNFMFDVIKNNQTVPVILADEKDNIIAWKNLDSSRIVNDTSYLHQKLNSMKAGRDPIRIDYTETSSQFIYYEDSFLLKQLRYFPYIQFSLIFIFLFVAYLAFSTSRRAEQNRVWVGMAKETAHQLGTPISSLSGWVDYLNEILPEDKKQKVVPEIEKDIYRLNTITDRFSKIGSQPALISANVEAEISKTIHYLKNRSSEKVEWLVHSTPGLFAKMSPPLFEWVMENLLKNALDAMEGKGKIEINIQKKNNQIMIDVKDNGKGILPSNLKTVFQPGFTTKSRGWGLGLSLSKRIIETYHSGKIFVKESQLNKGTTFRIILNSSNHSTDQ